MCASQPQTSPFLQQNNKIIQDLFFFFSPSFYPFFKQHVTYPWLFEAALLLLDLLALGGRLKRRALRGLLPQLTGLFRNAQPAVRTLGELVAKNAVDDPQLMDHLQVLEALKGMRRMIGDLGFMFF